MYFRLGDLQQAEEYLRPAWELTQTADGGGHLGQLYERQGKRADAAHMYELALAGSGGDKDAIGKHYEKLTGKKPPGPFLPLASRAPWPSSSPQTLKNRPTPRPTFVPSAGEELSRVRTVKIPGGKHGSGSAIFSMTLSPGKLDEVKFVSGEESLKDMTREIAVAQIRQSFPPGSAARVARRGMLVCTTLSWSAKAGAESKCDFVLLLPESTRTGVITSIPTPPPD